MKTLFSVLSLLMIFATAAQADWGRPGPGPGFGPGFGGPGPGPGRPGHGGPGPGWGRPVPPPPPQRFQTVYVNCESTHYDFVACPVMGQVMQASVVNQRSFASCDLGSTYGYQGNSIWVNRGCRATFAVTVRVF